MIIYLNLNSERWIIPIVSLTGVTLIGQNNIPISKESQTAANTAAAVHHSNSFVLILNLQDKNW